MISISIEVDETDLDTFAKVFTAAHAKLERNGVSMTTEAHRRAVLSRIFKTGLAEEQQRFLRDPMVEVAKKVQALYAAAQERMA